MKTYITNSEIEKKMGNDDFKKIVKTGDKREWKRLANKFVDVEEVLNWEQNKEEHYWIVWYKI